MRRGGAVRRQRRRVQATSAALGTDRERASSPTGSRGGVCRPRAAHDHCVGTDTLTVLYKTNPVGLLRRVDAIRACAANRAPCPPPRRTGPPLTPGLSRPLPCAGSRPPSFSPLYQQIKALITQRLQAGEWKAGETIPSEMELAARYGVSQGTVRKAIDELAAENLVVRRQGKGTFVATHAEQKVQFRFLRLMPDEGEARNVGPAASCWTATACAHRPSIARLLQHARRRSA